MRKRALSLGRRFTGEREERHKAVLSEAAALTRTDCVTISSIHHRFIPDSSPSAVIGWCKKAS
jgi:hypothetical protein